MSPPARREDSAGARRAAVRPRRPPRARAERNRRAPGERRRPALVRRPGRRGNCVAVSMRLRGSLPAVNGGGIESTLPAAVSSSRCRRARASLRFSEAPWSRGIGIVRAKRRPPRFDCRTRRGNCFRGRAVKKLNRGGSSPRLASSPPRDHTEHGVLSLRNPDIPPSGASDERRVCAVPTPGHNFFVRCPMFPRWLAGRRAATEGTRGLPLAGASALPRRSPRRAGVECEPDARAGRRRLAGSAGSARSRPLLLPSSTAASWRSSMIPSDVPHSPSGASRV